MGPKSLFPAPGIGVGEEEAAAAGDSACSKAPGMVKAGAGASSTGVGGLLSSCADCGLADPAGAMVPNRMLARCFALPPTGASSSSLSLSSLSLSALDHSSLSCRRRDCGPVKVGMMGRAASCWAIRWNGLVEGLVGGAEKG